MYIIKPSDGNKIWIVDLPMLFFLTPITINPLVCVLMADDVRMTYSIYCTDALP